MTQNSGLLLVAWGVRAAAATAVLIGGVWLAAWFGGWAAQWSAAGAITVKTNMALGQLLGGVALPLLRQPTAGWRRAVGTGLAGQVFLVGALTLSQHLFNVDLGIDQLLATEGPGAAATASPNRMGPPGSLSLALLGAALLALAWRHAVVPYIGLAVCLINLVPAVGFLYDIAGFFSRPHLTAIAWPTVVALLALGIGLVLTQPETGPLALLLRNDPGGALFRQLLPLALLMPLALGFVRVHGERAGWYDMPTGVGLLVLTLTLTFSALLWRSAAHLSRSAATEADAHRAVQASEARLAHAQEIANVGSWEWDIATGALSWSEQVYRQMGEQPGRLTPSYDAFQERIHPDDRTAFAAAIERALQGTSPYDLELHILRPDGAERVLHTRGEVVPGPDARPRRMVGVCLDITERKRAEKALRATLAEKEEALASNQTLLREVHHRVKNNLQMLCDLMYLQMEAMPDRDQHQGLQDAYSRVYAIARLHEQLYQSMQGGTIQLAEYLLRLVQGFVGFYPNVPVTLDAGSKGLVLDLDRAIHVGLIVNELVTNAMKHAFPAGQPGAVTVTLQDAGEQIQLGVRDNGRGLPENLDLDQAKSLGLRTVTILARRLEAQVIVTRNGGTDFTITFPRQGDAPIEPAPG